MKNEEIKIKNQQDDDKKKKRLIFIIIGVVIAVALAIVLPLTLTKCSTTKYTYGNPTYTWATDYSSCTAERVANEDPNHKETETVNSTYQVVDPAKCEVDGTGRYTATFTNEAFEIQTNDTTILATGHEWGTPTYEWSSDYSTCTAKRICAHDASHIDTETKASTCTVIVAGDCTNEGTSKFDVTFENAAFTAQSQTVTIPAGHDWGTPTYEWSSDNETCTATRVCNHDASHKDTETVNSTFVETTPASYDTEGEGIYTATFTNVAFTTQTKKVTIEKLIYYGEFPRLSDDEKTLTYGLYPQTNVNDPDLVTALNELTTPESNGYYFYNKVYYAKVAATPYDSSYTFDNGTTIVSDTTYWFKCEPIVWNVLSNNSGEYYILSSVLLDAHRYDGDSSNYANSEIRAWLNGDFYNSAFALGNSIIQTTTVDNSAATTSDSSNPYACSDTQDKVFLPSYQDYINSDYDFSTSTDSTDTRECKTTDWARARGSYCETSSSYLYNGWYWTRSPSSNNSLSAWGVDFVGNLNRIGVYGANFSVRPSLSINIA